MPADGDLLFRPAVSSAARSLELHLLRPGLGTIYPTFADAFRSVDDPGPLFAHHGIPTPRGFWCTNRNRARLRAAVDRVGGLPVVVKVDGLEGGTGVMIAESLPALFSLVDHLVTSGRTLRIMELVRGTSWRAVVIGDVAVATYRNREQPDDFRTYAGDDPVDYTLPPPAGVVDIAVRATALTGVELGGCDVLVTECGRAVLLEVNSPCYFPQAQQVVGIDVAGALVEHLIAKVS